MFPAMLLLAGLCADHSLCPTRKELEQAIKDRRSDEEWAANEAANRDRPLTLIMARRITRISNAHCAMLREESGILACTITLHYAEKLDPISFKIGRLEGKWSILGTAPIFF